jgi:cytochrome c
VRFEGGWEVKEKPEAPATPPTRRTAPKTPVTKTKAASATRSRERVLIAASDCKTCHSINKKIIGPTYSEIAQKYRSTPANIDKLSEKIIKGGAGVWGDVPMTPHPAMSREEAKKLVRDILQLRRS